MCPQIECYIFPSEMDVLFSAIWNDKFSFLLIKPIIKNIVTYISLYIRNQNWAKLHIRTKTEMISKPERGGFSMLLISFHFLNKKKLISYKLMRFFLRAWIPITYRQIINKWNIPSSSFTAPSFLTQ